ncbi:DUF6783 domain-containing protein [Oliverpabstia intestinalis]
MFYPYSIAVARYAALIRIKSPTSWDSQLTKSFFRHALELSAPLHTTHGNCLSADHHRAQVDP